MVRMCSRGQTAGSRPAADHGRRREHDVAARRGKLENFLRLEAAAFRHDVDAASHDMRQDVAAGAVRHRRGVQERIAGRTGSISAK